MSLPGLLVQGLPGILGHKPHTSGTGSHSALHKCLLMDTNLSKLWETVKDGEPGMLLPMGVTESGTT